MPEEKKQEIVTRKSTQKFEMADGSVKEVEVIHRRTKDDDDRMKRQEAAAKAGDPTGNSSAINLRSKKDTDGGKS